MTQTLALLLTGFVAFQHLSFLVLEMFLWTKPVGRKVFKLKPDFAKASAALAANQGLYNGFLVAGLVWSLMASDPVMASALQTFFLACVVVAGVFGAATVSAGILFVQAVPAALALVLHWIG